MERRGLRAKTGQAWVETGSQRQPPSLPRAQAREGEQKPFLPWTPQFPHPAPGEAGLLWRVPGEAAKIQLRREGVGEMDGPRAEARAKPQIRGRSEPETFSPGPCPHTQDETSALQAASGCTSCGRDLRDHLI